jgi:ribulose 1,5-bisphosphate synthetase/thiazole synthase
LTANAAPAQDDSGHIMPDAPIDIDVVVVGAGPVELFLANECARRRLRWRLIEGR